MWFQHVPQKVVNIERVDDLSNVFSNIVVMLMSIYIESMFQVGILRVSGILKELL